jgi:hypothetical protein
LEFDLIEKIPIPGSCPDSSCCGIPIETLVTGFLNEENAMDIS